MSKYGSVMWSCGLLMKNKNFPGNDHFFYFLTKHVLAVMDSPEALTSADIYTPVRSTNDVVVVQANKNCSNIVNLNSPGRKYIEPQPHPHEVSLDYNMRVQWERPGK